MEFYYPLDTLKVYIKYKIRCLNLRSCGCEAWAKWISLTENTEMQIDAIELRFSVRNLHYWKMLTFVEID